jgi:hypothetical protein
MNCPTCGSARPRRPTARIFMTGSLFVAAAIVLIIFIHLAVVVLASTVLLLFGISMLTGAYKARGGRCTRCGGQLRLGR